MELPRRQFLRLATVAAAVAATARSARAQSYPTRQVRIIVGFGPGGAPDIMARLIGQWLSARLGQSFIVENRPGATGNIATEAVVRAPPDGYTLLLVGTWNANNAALYANLKFDFIRDIAPVASIGNIPYVMVVNPSFPAKTVPDFISQAKANPGKLTMASPGIGTTPHLVGELFMLMTGTEIVHVPYRSSAPALTDLLGGQVQMTFGPLPSTIEYVRAGTLRALAVTTATRLKVLPDVPTVGEFVPGYEGTGRYGIGAPKDTPAEIIDKLNGEIAAGLADPKLQARLGELGAEPTPMAPAEFGRLIAHETDKWGKVIRARNIKVE
ncbi:MAG TPA: tripartite tricarboxylate transporter substrate binding protein [Xanthobacteraceae bacterium]|nr:tripartite tricarboxylate transporter substrate binding protein [Xanthobacteraceae bacterium]